MHPDKKKLICELFKDENKTQPVNPKKEAHFILADIIKWAFNNFPLSSRPPSLVWEPKLATQLMERCINSYFHFLRLSWSPSEKVDSTIIQFPIKANMRGGLGFNGTISGLHHQEYIWITSPGLCGNQPCCDGLEVKKCGCNVLLESTAFQECIQGVERSFQNRKERYRFFFFFF